jgi:hypothetical protein
MIRYEILLPLFYNDGRPIEPEKFLATDDELVQKFGSTSTDQVTVRGQWKYQSVVYSDQLIRVRIDLDEADEFRDAMRAYKETLKARFDQIDIWITAHRIDVIRGALARESGYRTHTGKFDKLLDGGGFGC